MDEKEWLLEMDVSLLECICPFIYGLYGVFIDPPGSLSFLSSRFNVLAGLLIHTAVD